MDTSKLIKLLQLQDVYIKPDCTQEDRDRATLEQHLLLK